MLKNTIIRKHGVSRETSDQTVSYMGDHAGGHPLVDCVGRGVQYVKA